MRTKILITLVLVGLAVVAMACSAPPTPTPTPTKVLPTPTLIPTATPTKAPPTVAPTLTPIPVTPTPSKPTETPRPPTRTPNPLPPRPSATPTSAKPPAPKGSIAYHWNDGGVDRISVLNVEKNTVTPFVVSGPVMDVAQTTNAHVGEWSPDNSKFAYIFAGAPNGQNILRVLQNGNTSDIYSSDSGGGLSSPTWSPDGKRIAFVHMRANQQSWALIIINADGTKCGGEQYECLVHEVAGQQYRAGVSWSKQNTLAVGYNTTGKNDIHLLYSDGGGDRNLTNDPADDGSPAWSPDGKLIAFTSTRDAGLSQIYVMNADGTGVRRVSQSKTADFSPAWSPDGKWLAFASTREGQTNVYMMDLNGNNVTQLTKTGGDHPTWTH